MATVKLFRGKHVADFRDAHGKRHVEASKGPFGSEAEERLAAHALLVKRLSEVSRDQYDPETRQLTFGAAVDRFLRSKVNLRPSTLRGYESLAQLYLVPYFGGWKIQSITTADIERYRFDMTQGVPSPILDARLRRIREANPKWSQARAKQESRRRAIGTRTVNKSLTLLTMILNYACRHRWIDVNPAQYVERLKDSRRSLEKPIDENILAPDEVKRLIDAADIPYRLIIQVAVFTGMRQGEILGLQWGDVDWNRRQFYVRRTWKEGAFHEPKTRASIRRVDIPEFLTLRLKEWRLQCPKGEMDLVFANGAGQPYGHSNLLQRGFYPALRRAGIRKVRFHDLRHTFASLLIANGEDIVRVSRLLGHASPNITLGIYSHMLPREHYGSTDRLADLVYGAVPPSSPALVSLP